MKVRPTMKTWRFLLTVGAATAASTTISCGDNSNTCGEGTVAVDGECVPVDDGADCGDGTILVDGECVPDGSVICEQGTVYDEAAGGCVPSDEVCGAGTVFVDGVCVNEDDAIVADHEEAAEPNDLILDTDDFAGRFAIPAVGADGTVFHGCITPYRDLDGNGAFDIDYDAWLVETTGPALVDIVGDGVHGLAAGYFVLPGTQQSLADLGWQRVGANLTSDTADRQVYLPEAGIYVVFMTDSRSIFYPDAPPAGSEETCYYVTVDNVAVPTPTALAADTPVTGALGTDSLFYSYDPRECDLVDFAQTVDSSSAAPSALAVVNGAVASYGEPGPLLGGLADADEVLLVVEPVYNYAIEPPAFSFVANALSVALLPTDGSPMDITNGNTAYPFALDDLTWACVDVGAGELVRFDLGMENESHLVFATRDLFVVSDVTGLLGAPSLETAFDGWVRFPEAGRYYAIFWNEDGVVGDTWQVTSTVDRAVPTAVTLETLVDDAPFSDAGATWHTVDPTTLAWLEYTASGTGFGGDLAVDLYPASSTGVFDLDFAATAGGLFAPAGGDVAGRVIEGDPTTFIVRVTDDGASADATATYDLLFGARDFTDLGTATEAAPVAADAVALGAGESALFLVRAAIADRVTITVAPADVDVSVRRLGVNETVMATVDAAGAAGAETLVVPALAGNSWVAFRVTNEDGTAGSFDADVAVVSPDPYTIATGSLTYADVCADPGAVDLLADLATGLGFADEDEGVTNVQTLPFAFDLHGEATSGDYRVSTNGWIAFGAIGTGFGAPAFTNATMPNSGTPNGLLAPFWDDLVATELCSLADADSVTFQWAGATYSTNIPIEFQATIHADGHIEYVYGPNHAGNGGTATVGIENLPGTFGHQVVYNTPGAVTPSSSLVLTP